MNSTVVLFIHGLFSSSRAWHQMIALLKEDEEILNSFDFEQFEYDSPYLRLSPARAIPDFNTLADSLANHLENTLGGYERVLIVTHSQGGLIALRMLARQLEDGRAASLKRVRRIVLFGCPNNGSEFLLSVRKLSAPWWRNSQERELRPLGDSVIEAQRRVLADVVFAPSLGERTCPIPIVAVAGASDNVVTPASAKSVYPICAVVPGDHSSLIRPNARNHLSYTTLRSNLMTGLAESFPLSHAVSAVTENLNPVYSELTVRGPIYVEFEEGGKIPFYVQSGPIDQTRGIDIVATSENSYLQMAMSFKPSVSGRIRRAAAVKGPAGDIREDVAHDELNNWLRKHGRFGLSVEPGTVVPTSSGSMIEQGVHRIYHAAIGSPIHGTDAFSVNPLSVAQAVHGIFALARVERTELGLPLRSIILPLFGAGLGGLDPRSCLDAIFGALQRELHAGEGWEIHISTWTRSETELAIAAIQALRS